MRVFLWGTGNVAKVLLEQCRTLSRYEIIGFIDSDPEAQGKSFYGFPVYPPKMLEECRWDRIVILSDSYEEIYRQIEEEYPDIKNRIENKNFFYKESLLTRYKMTDDTEELQVLDYIKKNGLDIFNYEFAEKYKDFPVEVFWDPSKDMFYVIHNNKRLYFSSDLDSCSKEKNYYRYILMEQDPI